MTPIAVPAGDALLLQVLVAATAVRGPAANLEVRPTDPGVTWLPRYGSGAERVRVVLTELLVSVAIVLGLLGVVFHLVDPSGGAVAVQSLVADVQQRQRARARRTPPPSSAGRSGPHPGMNGVVAHLRPAVAPSLRGATSDLARGTDRVSVLYAPPGEAGARLADDLTESRSTVGLSASGACALPCGLSDGGGGLALVFDATGRSDLYRITDLTGASAALEHVGGRASAYGAGSLHRARADSRLLPRSRRGAASRPQWSGQ